MFTYTKAIRSPVLFMVKIVTAGKENTERVIRGKPTILLDQIWMTASRFMNTENRPLLIADDRVVQKKCVLRLSVFSICNDRVFAMDRCGEIGLPCGQRSFHASKRPVPQSGAPWNRRTNKYDRFASSGCSSTCSETDWWLRWVKLIEWYINDAPLFDEVTFWRIIAGISVFPCRGIRMSNGSVVFSIGISVPSSWCSDSDTADENGKVISCRERQRYSNKKDRRTD